MSTTLQSPTKIRIRGLRKQFLVRSRSVEALAGVDLDIGSGEFFCIVGPSGCGKTTLLRIVAGLETKSSGSIDIVRERTSANGTNGTGRTAAGGERPLNSMVFQEQSIFPWMSVRDNIAFGLKSQGVGRGQRYELVRPFIHKVGLDGFEDALPHQLSGGMKQRVSIARAFANDPEILLMDEPFAALDEQTKLILQAELLRVWGETRKTVLYVTHSIDEAIVLADRVLIMSARPGRIKDIVDVGAVFKRPRQVEAVKSSPQYGELFARVWGQLRDEVLKKQEDGVEVSR
jgi:NitT/TauT family transport system ATP-binding protein